MRYTLSLAFLFVHALICAQSLNKADKLFSNYDFHGAGKMYEEGYEKKELNQERVEKLVFCLLQTGQSQKGLVIIDSILSYKTTEKEFYSWKAEFHRDLGQYDQAIEAISIYTNLGGEDDVKAFIASCELLKTTHSSVEGQLQNNTFNDGFASHFILTGGREVFLMEQGIDSAGNNLGLAGKSHYFSEGLLLKPYVEHNGALVEWKMIDDAAFNHHSIRSLHLNNDLKKLFFITNNSFLLNKKAMKPKMYSGTFEGFDAPLRDISEIQFLDDSLTPLQVTGSNSGTTLIFSAISSTHSHLFVSYWQDGKWSNPLPLSTLNSNGDELFPFLSGDTLFSFSSNRAGGFGGLDIYTARINTLIPFEVEDVKLLPMPFNSTKDDFLFAYLTHEHVRFSSNRFAGKGDDDVWDFVYPTPPEVIVVEAEPEINFADLVGKYNMRKVFFDFNTGTTNETIDCDSDFISLFNSMENTKIILKGHSDIRGTLKGNYEMGLRRAEWLKANLITQGFDPSKISTVSIGSTEITNKCVTRAVKCTEEEYRANRFVQLFIYY